MFYSDMGYVVRTQTTSGSAWWKTFFQGWVHVTFVCVHVVYLVQFSMLGNVNDIAKSIFAQHVQIIPYVTLRFMRHALENPPASLLISYARIRLQRGLITVIVVHFLDNSSIILAQLDQSKVLKF